MRAIRAAVAALLPAAALAVAAPTATAANGESATPFGYTMTPSSVAPGGRVSMTVTNCLQSATVSSPVFDRLTIPSGRTATATVDRNARPGSTHTVTFTCNGRSGTAPLTIADAPAVSASTDPPVPTVSSVSVAPGGVRGGLGGSIGGLNTAEIVAGTALVVIAATGTIYAVRRRTENRGH